MNIFRLILSIFGLAGATTNQVRIAYDRIVRFLLIVALPALLTSYILNIGVSRWDWWAWLAYIPYVMGLVITGIFLVIAFLPEVLAGVGILNLVSTNPQWVRYRELVWLTVAWINIPFMFVGGVPGGANPMAVFAILSTITIISIATEGSRWRKIVTWSAMAILAINLLTLVSQPVWMWMTGHELGFHISQTEKALLSLENTRESIEDATNAKMLQSIEAKVATGQKLTKQEEAFLATAKALREKNSLPSLTKAKLAEVKTKLAEFKPAPPAPTPPPVAKTGKVVVPVATGPVTVGTTPTPPAPPAITPPTPEIWNLRFYRGHQMMEQKMSVTRTGADIFIKATVDGTTFKGSFRRNRYEGTVAGPGSNGTFILHFLPNGEATGEVFVGQKIIISMTRLS